MQDNFGLENTRRELQQLINFLSKKSLKENDLLLDEAVTWLMTAESYLNKHIQYKRLACLNGTKTDLNLKKHKE
tara:strand:- start:346 stop:567 length:222 start_codon:yes stop_codon:yes gene_type:complete